MTTNSPANVVWEPIAKLYTLKEYQDSIKPAMSVTTDLPTNYVLDLRPVIQEEVKRHMLTEERLREIISEEITKAFPPGQPPAPPVS